MYLDSTEYSDKKIQNLVERCKSAAISYNFTEAHEKLIELESFSQNRNSDRITNFVNETFDYVFNAEAMYLCSKGDKESINRLVFLLSSIPIKGIAIPNGTEYISAYDMNVEEHEVYINYANRFNQKCAALIDLAIANHNFTIVEHILPLFKPTTMPFEYKSIDKRGEPIKHKVIYSNKTKDDAITKINAAINDGLFPGQSQMVKNN